jgi:hypothetical protein
VDKSRSLLLFYAALIVTVLLWACGDDNGTSTFDGGQSQDGNVPFDSTSSGPDVMFGGDGGFLDGSNGTLTIVPPDQVVNVTYGQQTPTVQFSAILWGSAVTASFSVDRGEVANIVTGSGLASPTGQVGGLVHVTATYGSQTATTTLTYVVHLVDNGSTVDAGVGTGGYGGVGGPGPGGTVDGGTETVLLGTPAADPGLSWLYPYDKTVWPQGVLAPLLQWNAPRNYDSVYIHLVETGFEYQGYFAANATPFINTPILPSAWTALTDSNEGEPVNVTLVFSANGTAYGPLNETWTIAQGLLTGTVYYNSYGTNLAHNYCCTIDNQKFGGATLAIKHGASSPVLVAGSDSECRVCHSVSADGSRLVTQQGSNYDSSSWYDLSTYTEYAMTPAGTGVFAWPAMYHDGSMLLSDGAPLAGGSGAVAALYSVSSGASITSTGLPSGLKAGSPVFSPDGKHIAFNFYGGSATEDGGTLNADKVSLAAMDYDPMTSQFSNFRILYTPTSGTALWPSFLPTNDAVVFELETVNNGRDWGGTRSTCDSSGTCSNSGTQAELWWVDLATQTAARLDALNGLGYLPTLMSTAHTNDAVLNYEPTINPVPSGGYAWAVFTSRRLYGNIATINPYWSDPRYHDISVTPTPKKLWVAAIDLSAKPGTDPSHPAFYLPAQELLAGNSRGYWVVDPCEANGSTCETGTECCGGYCEDTDGGFVCTNLPPSCSSIGDKCTTSSDCCGAMSGVQCINGFCAVPTPL